MKSRIFLAAAIAAVPAALPPAAASAGPDMLASHLWQSRFLVVLAPRPGDARAVEQRHRYRQTATQNGERDLVLVERYGTTPEAAALRARFGVADGEFRVILVGKDGGAKLVSSTPLEPGRLFREIDGMPMRQDEMRQDEMRRRTR